MVSKHDVINQLPPSRWNKSTIHNPQSTIEMMNPILDPVGIPQFSRPELLEIALTHFEFIEEQTNFAPAQKELGKLEFVGLSHLGSRVLNAITQRYLSRHYPQLGSATRTLIKGDLISRSSLAEFALKLNLTALARLPESYAWKHPFEQNKILAQLFEAVVGAVYFNFDENIAQTCQWLESLLKNKIEQIWQEALNDPELESQHHLDFISWKTA